jgi:hypothetical protein
MNLWMVKLPKDNKQCDNQQVVRFGRTWLFFDLWNLVVLHPYCIRIGIVFYCNNRGPVLYWYCVALKKGLPSKIPPPRLPPVRWLALSPTRTSLDWPLYGG